MAFYAGEKLKAANLGQLTTTAQYQATANQTISTSSSTFVAFAGSTITTSLVTRTVNGAGHTFTLNSSGLWAITATLRYSAQATGYREVWLQGPIGHICGSSQPASASSPATMILSICQWLDAGTGIAVATFQDAGSNATLLGDTSNAYGRIDLACLLVEA